MGKLWLVEEQVEYDPRTLKKILRYFQNLDDLSAIRIDLLAARECLDALDRKVFDWVILGQSSYQIGHNIKLLRRDNRGRPECIGRHAVSRLLKRLAYYLNHPYLMGVL